jgi:hypothetical protein
VGARAGRRGARPPPPPPPGLDIHFFKIQMCFFILSIFSVTLFNNELECYMRKNSRQIPYISLTS